MVNYQSSSDEDEKLTSRRTTPSDRKSILESLVKKRRESFSAAKARKIQIENLTEKSESEFTDNEDIDDFIASDDESSVDDRKSKKQRLREDSSIGSVQSDSESDDSSDRSSSVDPSSPSSDDSSESSGSEDAGFYARINSMMDKSDSKLRKATESLSTRQSFRLCIQYYAMCLVSRDCKYPVDSGNKKLGRILPQLQVAVKRIERELLSRRDNMRPSYWRDDAKLVRALKRFTDTKFIRVGQYYQHRQQDEPCEACHRSGWTCELRLSGDSYDSTALWKGDISGWLEAMQLPRIGKARSSPSTPRKAITETQEISDEEMQDFITQRIYLGTTCADNVAIFHALQHAKNFFIRQVYDFIIQNRLADSLTSVVKTLKKQKDGIVERWFQKFEEFIAMSESKFDHDDDHNPSNVTIKLPSKSKKINRF